MTNTTGILNAQALTGDIPVARRRSGRTSAAENHVSVFAALLGRLIQLIQWSCLLLAIWLVSCNEFYDTPLWMPLSLCAAAVSQFRLAPRRLRK